VRARVQAVVSAELERTHHQIGEPQLMALHQDLPRTLVRSELRAQTAAWRRERRQARAAARSQITALHPDVLHGLDATLLGRDEDDHKIEGQVLRDIATAEVLEVSAGPPVTSLDAIAILVGHWMATGRVPLVVMTDGGPPYTSAVFEAFLEAMQVVHLTSVPRTPEHNAHTERGIGEVKDVADLGADVRTTVRVALLLARYAMEVLNRWRVRPSRGGMSARDFRRTLAPWYALHSRAAVYAAASSAVEDATRGVTRTWSRRARARRAILGTLERFGLITWNRGGGHHADHKAEGIT
jgi:hypothetical protein